MPSGVCRCGHSVDRHEANECWTGEDGNETWDWPTACPCTGYEEAS